MKYQKGFTALELVAVIGFFLWAAAAVGAIWTVCHFIAKFW